MLCTKCGRNEATVFYRQNINGHVTESALCEECAGELTNGMKDEINENGFFGMDLLGSFFGLPQTAAHLAGTPAQTKVCPLCGATYKDIVRESKVGCARCYDTFRRELASTIERIHGRVTHTGRAPAGYAEENRRQRKLDELKSKMNEAIEKQDFENAAKLRDEIKKLDNKSSK